MKIKEVVGVLFIACLGSSAFAYEVGDLILRAGAAAVDPNENSENVTGGTVPAGVKVGADSDTALGLTGTYMLTRNVGLEVLASTPFTHTVSFEGILSGSGSLGRVKHLPPTISAQYFFDTGSIATPYVGLGVNYFMVLESEMTGNGATVLGSSKLDVDDSVGLALSAGVDVQLSDHLVLNAAVWKIDVDTRASIDNSAFGNIDVDLEIDPWAYMMGIGYKF